MITRRETVPRRKRRLWRKPEQPLSNSTREDCDYILNIHTKKIHLPDCSSVKSMDEDNMAFYKGDEDGLLSRGYTPWRETV